MRTSLAVFCFCLVASAQAPPSDVPTMQALLSEVRQLRMALERSTTFGPRIQIAVERLKIQLDAVNRISRQLDENRRDLEHTQTEQVRYGDKIKSVENELGLTADLNQRRNAEQNLKMLNFELDQLKKSEQQIRSRESELAGALQTEQARLNEVNDRLSQIERGLAQ